MYCSLKALIKQSIISVVIVEENFVMGREREKSLTPLNPPMLGCIITVYIILCMCNYYVHMYVYMYTVITTYSVL